MATELEEFGYRVRDARTRKGWKLEDVAREAFANPDRKGYVSQIENGKITISPRTVGNLARVLDLPEGVTAPLLRQPLPPDDQISPKDRNAERLIAQIARDTPAPPAEALLIALAYEFAPGTEGDLITASNGLRAALAAAAEMKARSALPQNTDDQLQEILRQVARLNDQNQRDAAADLLEAEMQRIEANRDAVVNLQLKQDRIRNRPDLTAQRLVARLKSLAPAGGVFRATLDLLNEWRDRGERFGDPFDLSVALELARLNHARAKGPQYGQALLSLGNCHCSLGQRQSGGGHLTRAVAFFTAALKEVPRKLQPNNWAATQNNLGGALRALGEREGDSARLTAAIAAYTAALTVRTQDATPMDWAGTQNNLGGALRALGEREGDSARLTAAIAAYTAALTVRTKDATPMDWAGTQNNLGNALQALGEREGDSARLTAAITAYTAALTVRTQDATPMDWAATQNNLGGALQALGKREGDSARLTAAITAYTAALTVRTQDATPMDWAATQNNLGNAHRWLGTVTRDGARFDLAAAAFDACLTQHRRDTSPFLWAQTQWNFADLALARHALAPARGLLDQAQNHLDAARQVFAGAGNDHQIAECDRLQGLIDAA